MHYPVEILPNSYYKFIDCSLDGFYLIRKTQAQVGERIIDDAGLISQKMICDPTAHISDLSTSLLSIFNSSHLRIQLTDNGKQKYSDYCLPDEFVQAPIYDEHFTLTGDKEFWVVKIDEINNYPINFNDDHQQSAICKVIHTPAKWNYWHFSIRWETPGGFINWNDSKELKRGPTKRLCHLARAFITEHAMQRPLSVLELSKTCYFKEHNELSNLF